VYIVDDNAQMQMSLAFLLDSLEIQYRIFESGEAFLDCLDTLAPGPLLLDIRMSRIDGIGVLTALSAKGVKWPVIVMTGHGDIAIAVKAMKLGAIEFLEKPFEPEALVDSLTRGFDILAEMARTLHDRDAARQQLATLTPREHDVVRALIDGSANKIVAYRLGLSSRTVEMHRANALAKLGLKCVPDLIRLVSTAAVAVPAATIDSPPMS
jgi:two-component system response regulator FixJ